jgi:hypothetical protein
LDRMQVPILPMSQKLLPLLIAVKQVFMWVYSWHLHPKV